MAYDQDILTRLKQRGSVNPIRKAIGNAMVTLGTGKPPDNQEDAVIDQLIKYNQFETGSPEFKMKEAQTRADMNLQSALDIEDAKRQIALKRAQEAGYVAGPSVETQESASSRPFLSGNLPQPSIPAIARPELSPIGNMPMNSKTPRFIQVPKSPAGEKYDPNIGAMVKTPAEYGYEIDPVFKQELENEGALKKEEGKLQVKRSDFGKTVDSFRAISDQMPRKYGLDRFKQGARNIYSRTMQEEGDPLASTSATYEGAKNNLVVSIARLKDVGNLSKSEQDAANALAPQDIDSPQVYETKMAYLDALAGATTPEEIKSLINSWATGQAPPKLSNNQFSSPEEADASGLSPGTKVTVNGRPYEI